MSLTGILGLSALRVALGMAVLAAALAARAGRLAGRRAPGHASAVKVAYAAVHTTGALLVLASLSMVYGLVTHDFSISYVAQVGSRATPLVFTVVSLWSALEGSILFWGLLIGVLSAAVVHANRARPGALVPYAAATLMTIAVFFLVLLVGPANPFNPVFPIPADGPGPNPLLQNHILMAVHPPLLYLGYVGMSVPFAFAVGAMLSGEPRDDEWLRLTRTWTIAAWMFLSAAIVAGMWWSYEVLGWGGYWAWDPVENASLMPWLTATAFLHSAMVEQRRGMLRVWNLNLVVSTFVLTILGTFLTRSGVLSSVHAFTQGTIGYFFLAFIALVLLVSLALVAGFAGGEERTADSRLDSAVSREAAFLVNNLLLSAVTFTVLLGTLFPLVAEAIRGVKVTVGGPFFNRMTLPLGVTLLFLMGVGPALPWRRGPADRLKRDLALPAAALVVALGVALIVGTRAPYALAAFGFGAFALTANAIPFWVGMRARMRAHGEAAPVALVRLVSRDRHRYGGFIVHAGVIAMAVGIAASSVFKAERDVTLKLHESVRLGDTGLRLERVWGQEQPQRFTVGAELTVLRGDLPIGTLEPKQNFYPGSEEPVPTPAVRSRPGGDLYASLMAFDQEGATATLRVLREPLVGWIWAGGGIVCLGALVALWPRRRAPRPRETGGLRRSKGGGREKRPVRALVETAEEELEEVVP